MGAKLTRMAIMRFLVAGLLLWSCCGATSLPKPSLKALYTGHRWFQLRDALAPSKGPALYKGAVASAFGQRNQAETLLNSVIAASPHSDEASQAHNWLFYLYMRAGQYPQAVAQLRAEYPARSDHANAGERALIRAFERLPSQQTEHFQPSHLRYSIQQNYVEIPLKVNGKKVHFYLDSDANVSAMSARQAKQLGVTVYRTDAKMLGATGAGAGLSLGVVKNLKVGDIRLRNVAFMIVPDDKEPFNAYPLGERGFIGIPVLLALKALHWTKGGDLDIGFESTVRTADANLCFDGADPVTKAGYEGSEIEMVLDTGSRHTQLWPPFAHTFPSVLKTGKESSTPVRGFGGDSNVDSLTLPKVILAVGGFNADLQAAHILLKTTTPNSGWYTGRLGIDVLNQAQSVTLDFRSMTLTLQGASESVAERHP